MIIIIVIFLYLLIHHIHNPHQNFFLNIGFNFLIFLFCLIILKKFSSKNFKLYSIILFTSKLPF